MLRTGSVKKIGVPSRRHNARELQGGSARLTTRSHTQENDFWFYVRAGVNRASERWMAGTTNPLLQDERRTAKMKRPSPLTFLA